MLSHRYNSKLRVQINFGADRKSRGSRPNCSHWLKLQYLRTHSAARGQRRSEPLRVLELLCRVILFTSSAC